MDKGNNNSNYEPNERTANFGIVLLLIFAFVAAGITAPILIGQSIARTLTAIGISSHLTIWLVPAAPLMVVYVFYNIFKKIGLKI